MGVTSLLWWNKQTNSVGCICWPPRTSKRRLVRCHSDWVCVNTKDWTVPQPAAPLCHPVFIEILKLNGDFLLPKATWIAHTLFPAVSEYSSRPPPFPHHHHNRTDLIGQTVFLLQSHIIRCPEPGSFRGPALQSLYRPRPVLAKWQIGSHFAVCPSILLPVVSAWWFRSL